MYHVKNIGFRVINPIPHLSYQDHAKIVISIFFLDKNGGFAIEGKTGKGNKANCKDNSTCQVE